MPTIHYTRCPVCDSGDFQFVFTVRDHTVSGEQYSIIECKNCLLRFTQDVPDEETIGSYYKSDQYISHSDTSQGVINSLYQRVRKRTLKQKRKLVEEISGVKKGYLLDLGSGTGSFANEMMEQGWQVTAVEPDEDARKKAKEQFGIELKENSHFDELPASAFDAITLWHVLEHVHQLHRYVEQLRILLKPHGRIFIAVPNYTSVDAAVYQQYWAAYDVPRHLYHFSPQSMQVLMEKHQLKIDRYLPMWYDSFYVSMLSSKYRKGSTNLPGAVMQGLKSNWTALSNKQRCSSVIYVISK